MSPDDLGPLHRPQPPERWSPPIIDAKFKVVLSPEEKLSRRVHLFGRTGAIIGGLLAGAVMLATGPTFDRWLARVEAPLTAWLFGSPSR